MSAIATAIPFNRPSLWGREIEYMTEAVARGQISGEGGFTKRSQALLESLLGTRRALLTTSCTHALEMTALLLDLKAGDEVILPSFTFVSTANAFALRGARPILADIRADTLNIDEERIERLITPRTKAIVVVHYGGVACAMDEILAIAHKHGLAVIEDNAHGLLGRYRDRALGTMGCMATQSFHETKNFTCGEGGALLINEERYIERAEIIREKGTNRSRFFRGLVDKYTWVDVGSSYVLSDMLAAFLLAQIEQREAIQAARQRVWDRYAAELGDWARQHAYRLPSVPAHCRDTQHVFYVILTALDERQHFIEHMRAREILCTFHYVPLNLSPMGQALGARPGDCPVAESISERLVRLPLFNDMTADEQTRVITAAREFPR
jgi:dTDP-4-amino-4,6-dideoxygalactose transaminase